MPDLLRAETITKHYGGVCALNRANFSVRAGEVHALMGENGAGKSTLAKIISGSVRPDSGTICIDGRNVHIQSPVDAQSTGIGIIYQELDLFPHLTLGENMVIGNLHFKERRLIDHRRIEAFCRPFLEQVGLHRSSRTLVSSLPIGQRQLLAIARTVSMNAAVIFMDEPTSSLFDDAVENLFRIIAALKQRGVAIVYVSHKMTEIFRICDRVTVMRDGETIGTRGISETNSREIIRMMVGREVNIAARPKRSAGTVLLRVESLSTAKLKSITFNLCRGEVLGIAGLVGSGRSELGAALFGLDKLTAGYLFTSLRDL